MVHEQCTLPAVWLKKWRKDTGDFGDSIIVGCDGLFGFLVYTESYGNPSLSVCTCVCVCMCTCM